MSTFSAYVAFNTATNGETDIKHEKKMSRKMMAWYIEDETNKNCSQEVTKKER